MTYTLNQNDADMVHDIVSMMHKNGNWDHKPYEESSEIERVMIEEIIKDTTIPLERRVCLVYWAAPLGKAGRYQPLIHFVDENRDELRAIYAVMCGRNNPP